MQENAKTVHVSYRSLTLKEIIVNIACLDFEGVLIPEIWINVAERTGIKALLATTRDIPDYDVLMRQRLRILDEHNLTLPDIQKVIAEMGPLAGAYDFLKWLKERFQVVIISDTFYEFAQPLVQQLDYPVLLCHQLEVAQDGRVTGYTLRQKDPKRKSVQAFHSLEFGVIATGDSYNDVTMLEEADAGILYCPPEKVIAEFPQYPVARDYNQLRKEFLDADSLIG